MKIWLARLGVAVLSMLLSLGAIEVALSAAADADWIRLDFANKRGRKSGLYAFDADLGWKNRPGFDATHQWAHRSTRERINRRGWRDRRYPKEKGDGVFRIAALGCSFTYGYGVDMEESYPHRLEELLNEHASRTYEVMNFGVNGYGTAQMILNYEKFVRDYAPELVILQLFDFNVHRSLYTNVLNTEKPSYVLEDGNLVLVNHPVPEDRYRSFQRWLLDRSLVYGLILDRQLRTSSRDKNATKKQLATNQELHALVTQMLARLRELTEADGSQLLIMADLDWLAALATAAGVEVFDLHRQVAMRRWSNQGAIHNPEPVGHWSPLGNDYVAHAVFEYLSGRETEEGKHQN